MTLATFSKLQILSDGVELQLSLSDPDQQLQAVKDLLQRQLIHTAWAEQQPCPRSNIQWFARVAEKTANDVLTGGPPDSYLENPLHMVALMVLLLGCNMRVSLPVEEPNRSLPKSAKRARHSNASRGIGSTPRLHSYLFVNRPDINRGMGCIPDANDAKDMLLQMSLRQENNKWMFDVVSYTMTTSRRMTHKLGEGESYEACTQCGKGSFEGPGGGLLCCRGEHCPEVLHAMHMPQRNTNATWWCSTCKLRERHIGEGSAGPHGSGRRASHDA